MESRDGAAFGYRVATLIIAVVVVCAAASLARSVLGPLAAALFIMGIVWPAQKWLQSRIPQLAALAIVLLLTITICLAFTSLAAWAFGRVGHFLIADAARYQAYYERAVAWLDNHGIEVAGLWAEYFNVGWVLRAMPYLTGRVNTILSFWLIALVYVVLGLIEIDDVGRRIDRLQNRTAARVLRDGSRATAVKFRKYLLVRTQMSVVTGLLVALFAAGTGLPFAFEWGVIAFVLNYIPFIGPFVATLCPTLLAMTQFESWTAVFGVFACLNVIQFVVGSYVEPRVAGATISISPFIVLLAIFLWTFLWGLFGTFIGVPITLALLTFCAEHPSTRWIAELLGGATEAKQEAL